MRAQKYDQRLFELEAEGLTDQRIAEILNAEGFRTAQGRQIDRGSIANRRWYLKLGKCRPRPVLPADIIRECRSNGTLDAFRQAFSSSEAEKA